jgi:hypothetical protein
LAVPRFELRASGLKDRISIVWAISTALFCSGYFRDRVSLFCPGWPGQCSFYFTLPTVAEITGTSHHTWFFFHWNGVLQLFYTGWPGTSILPISAS